MHTYIHKTLYISNPYVICLDFIMRIKYEGMASYHVIETIHMYICFIYYYKILNNIFNIAGTLSTEKVEGYPKTVTYNCNKKNKQIRTIVFFSAGKRIKMQ